MGSVADSETTVLLSSHLLADLERVCDYLMVLHAARVQLVGAVDDLVAGHRQLVGPRNGGRSPSGVEAVVRESHTDRQSTLLVRTGGAIDDPSWSVREVGLEDIILAYLADGDTTSRHTEWGVPA